MSRRFLVTTLTLVILCTVCLSVVSPNKMPVAAGVGEGAASQVTDQDMLLNLNAVIEGNSVEGILTAQYADGRRVFRGQAKVALLDTAGASITTVSLDALAPGEFRVYLPLPAEISTFYLEFQVTDLSSGATGHVLFEADCAQGSIAQADRKPYYEPDLGAQEGASVSPLDTGGPDGYGYIWDDGVWYSWIDATDGSPSWLNGDDSWAGFYSLGFTFDFYGNHYTEVAFNTNGYLSFGQGSSYYYNFSMPNATAPNNIIAPFWDDLCVNYGGYNTGTVYYKQGGSAPNRYFVVEWYQVSRLGSTDLLTFEAILYENGTIRFQYNSLSGDLTSATVGIENRDGSDGLQYLYNSSGLCDSLAVEFRVPGPRVSVFPDEQGEFASAGSTTSYQAFVKNIGDSTDLFDLTATSSWPVSFYDATGTSPLPDANGNSIPDTGYMVAGQGMTVTVKVQAPSSASRGSADTVTILASSALSPSQRYDTVLMKAAVPVPFVQTYWRPDSSGNYDVILGLVQPKEQQWVQASTSINYEDNAAVATGQDGDIVNAWVQGYTNSYGHWVWEIHYAIRDYNGTVIKGETTLTDNSGATPAVLDYNPVAAVAPNGNIVVAWTHEDSSNDSRNPYYAVLDGNGNLLRGPTALTENISSSIRDYDPTVAATSDGRFIVTWEHYDSSEGICDVYYAVLDSSGQIIHPITNLTQNTGDFDDFDPRLAALEGNQVIVVWEGEYGATYSREIFFAVLDSSGNVVKSETPLTNNVDEGGYSYDPDAVRLANGNIAIAWVYYRYEYETKYQIQYAFLNSSFITIVQPTTLTNTACDNNWVPSVTADRAGDVIITWVDNTTEDYLFYAALDHDGNVLTDPMIYRTAQAGYIFAKWKGYGNAMDLRPVKIYLPVTLKDYFPAQGPLENGKPYTDYPNTTNRWYYVDLDSNATLTVKVTNYMAVGQLLLYNYPYHQGDKPIVQYGSGGSTMSVSAQLSPGRYLIRVYTSGSYSSSQLYTLIASW